MKIKTTMKISSIRIMIHIFFISTSLAITQAYQAMTMNRKQTNTFVRIAKTENYESTDWLEKSILQDYKKATKRVLIYDTSLRDGTQGESVNVSCEDKIKIAQRLSSFDIDYIEAGWPGSNPKDVDFFKKSETQLDEVVRKKLVAFGSTRRKNMEAHLDPQMIALKESNCETICIVAKASKKQVCDILNTTEDENLKMIEDSIKYLVSLQRKVYVDLEHFFDGYKFDHEYTLKCCEVAVQAGVSGLVLCDTNGGSMPWEIQSLTKIIVDNFDVTVGIHCHNDCGLAIANSLSAVEAGATLVQGTINGIGERTGNADLCAIIPNLALKMDLKASSKKNLKELTKLSRFVDEILNRNPNPAAPFVGQSAFAHKGGLHVAALEKDPLSYQHIDPKQVGNDKRILISELSGRQNILQKMKETQINFGDSLNERALAILNHVKSMENIGYTFEGADASVYLMIMHMSDEYCPPFKVLDYSAQVFDFHLDSASRAVLGGGDEYDDISKDASARATVRVNTADHVGTVTERLEVSDGNGPVDALSKALFKALGPSHPILANIELVDYKVRILDPDTATSAATRVMIEFKNIQTEKLWTTVSVDRNIISASLTALLDGYEYALLDVDNDIDAPCIL